MTDFKTKLQTLIDDANKRKFKAYKKTFSVEYVNPYLIKEDFEACAKLPSDLLVKALVNINKVSNNMGLDIKMVEYETVWSDPDNVRKTLEITQEVRIKEFTKLKELINEIRTALEGAAK